MIELSALRRPAEDILSRSIRFTLGGEQYVLPVRSIRANREWKERLDADTSAFLGALDADEDLGSVYAALAAQADALIELLLSYDTTGSLPSKDEIEGMEPDATMDVLAAVREVWRAANPLVAMSLDAIQGTIQESGSSAPTSSPPTSTAGRRRSSRKS